MKQKTLYTIAILIFGALFFLGCEKNNVIKKKKLATDTITTKGDTVVSTIASGNYNYIAADTSGNVYALHVNRGADTIFKFDKSGNRSFFYTTPVTMNDDTAVTSTLTCLATDSAGNVYSVVYNGPVNESSLVKISPAGAGSIAISSFLAQDNIAILQIGIDGSGSFYYLTNNEKISKIFTNGVSQVLTTTATAFAVDRQGDVFYPVTNSSGQTGIDEIYRGGVQVIIAGVGSTQTSVTFGNLYSLTTDRAGNVYIAYAYNNNTDDAIVKLKYTAYNNTNPAWQQASVLIQSPLGHVDGAIATAQIYAPISMATDAAGNLYFSEANGGPLDIRKITF